MGAAEDPMAKKGAATAETKVGVATSEWMCRRHGFQPAPKDPKNAKCKWCGNPLTLNTWTMSGGKT